MEKEINNNNKPPHGLTVQLFLFMLLVFVVASGLKNSFDINFNNPLHSSNKSLIIFAGIIDLLAYCYGFLAIYKTLQRKPYSIMMLKLSVFYIFIQLLCRILERDVTSFGFTPLLYLPFFFLLFFFIYLFKSKGINKYIPKEERKRGVWGFLGFGIYILVIVLYILFMKEAISMEYYSRPISKDKVVLKKNEVTDGFVIFRPLDGWTCDTVTNNNKSHAHYYITKDSSVVIVSSVVQECKSRTDYYGLLKSEEFGFPDSLKMKEIAFKDSTIRDNRYYLNIYSFNEDEDTIYLTFSALKDIRSHKMMTMSIFEVNRHGNTTKMSDSFMNTVRFDLETR